MARGLEIGFGQVPRTLNASPLRLATFIQAALATSVVASSNYLGMNLAPIGPYSPQVAFRNIMKTAGNNSNCSCWFYGATVSNLSELQLDSDGYPTSMTGNSGTTYTSIYTLINYANVAYPNQTTLYPSGQYTLTFTGNGTIQVLNDASAIVQTPTGGSSISGTSLTISDGGTHSMTFNVNTPSTSGLKVSITSIGGGTGAQTYPIGIDVRQSIYAPGGANYVAGEIFDPNFIAKLTPYSRLRFMDWLQTNSLTMYFTFTTVLAAGATEGTLSSAWAWKSGTYQTTINNATAQVVTATMTAGSTDVNWTQPLTSAGNLNGAGASLGCAPRIANWAARPKPSACCYSELTGVPLEVCMQLANETDCDAWLNCGTVYDGTYVTNMAQMAYNGMGAQSGFNGGTFTGVNLKCYLEYGNENWNGFLGANCVYNIMMGSVMFPTASSSPGGNFNKYYAGWEYTGVQTANMADAWYAVFGSDFATKVVASMPGQYTNNAVMVQSLSTPDWSGGPASSHHIGAVHIAPYIGSILSTADAATMEAEADPVSCFFQLLTSDTYNGTTFSSVTAKSPNGYLGYTATQVASARSYLNTKGYTALPLLGYEMGTSFTLSGTANSNDSTYLGIIASFHRDPRISTFYQTYLTQLQTSGLANGNQFNDVTAITKGGEWGTYENSMQPNSGPNLPPKAAGQLAWIAA